MSLPVFIDLTESDQISEVRKFLRSKGADINEEPNGHGLVAELSDIIRAIDVCWKEAVTDAEVETVVNSIVALLLYVPSEQAEPLIRSFCDSMSAAKATPAKLKVLSNLFYGLEDHSQNRYYVYIVLIKLAAQGDLLHLISPNFEDVKRWLVQWKVNITKQQKVLIELHNAYDVAKQTEKATKVMIELLGTYTEENASQARDYAHKCIVSCLAEPSYFLLDHLLTLKPVKFLEGELIHDLLTIFVSGKLSQYLQFHKTNSDFISSIGLSHDNNLRKMRVLTFMQMAEKRTEIDFQTIQKEMQIEEDDVESFLIDVVRTKTVRAKIDHLSRTVLISSTTYRTFGRHQWQLLRDELQRWQNNLTQVMSSIQTVMPSH